MSAAHQTEPELFDAPAATTAVVFGVVAMTDVRPGALPAGRVARLAHHGSYGELGTAWERLGAWVAERGLTPGNDLWEVYVTEPSPDMDPADLRTELNWSVR